MYTCFFPAYNVFTLCSWEDEQLSCCKGATCIYGLTCCNVDFCVESTIAPWNKYMFFMDPYVHQHVKWDNSPLQREASLLVCFPFLLYELDGFVHMRCWGMWVSCLFHVSWRVRHAACASPSQRSCQMYARSEALSESRSQFFFIGPCKTL